MILQIGLGEIDSAGTERWSKDSSDSGMGGLDDVSSI